MAHGQTQRPAFEARLPQTRRLRSQGRYGAEDPDRMRASWHRLVFTRLLFGGG